MSTKLSQAFLSCFYVGFLPYTRGTYGALFGAVFVFLLRPPLLTQDHFIKGTFLVIILAILSYLSILMIRSQLPATDYDQSWIVMDEFIGITISLSFVFWIQDHLLLLSAIAFLLFRFFDIAKPLGIKAVDQLHTPSSVILDDIIAGVYALLCTLVIYLFL
jgi:phosphatidylglycerophosphatase A